MYHDLKLSELNASQLDENTWMVLSYVNDTKDFPKYCSQEFRWKMLELDFVTNPWHYELTELGKQKLKHLTEQRNGN